jgi:hypothetical protein
MIGNLPETLADRCVVIRMQRKMPGEECERLRDWSGEVLRRKCARFVKEHASEIVKARPEVPNILNDRAADVWEPLLALADIAGGAWPQKARQAAVGLSASAQESSPSEALLADVQNIFIALGQERIFSRTLLEQLNLMPERPWAASLDGKGVTELWLARQLRPHGIRTRTIRIQGEQAKGYLKEEFGEVFRRYGGENGRQSGQIKWGDKGDGETED